MADRNRRRMRKSVLSKSLRLQVSNVTTPLRYTHVHSAHVDAAISTLGRTLPERVQNKKRESITPELHIVTKKRV